MIILRKIHKLGFLFIIVLYLMSRLPALGTDLANTDSLRWHRRSERFLTALKQKDFKSTYQHYQPGVTLMWLNSVVKQVDFSLQLKKTDTPKTLETSDHFPIIHKYSKATLVLVLALLLTYQLNLISKIFAYKTAFVYGLLITFEPYLLGIDRWFHLTSLETYFGMASFLSLLMWTEGSTNEIKKEIILGESLNLFLKNKYFVFSAILFALAVLSKLTSLILAPVLVIIILVKIADMNLALTPLSVQKKGSNFINTLVFEIKKILQIDIVKIAPLLIFLILFLVTFFVVFPALWVAPFEVISKLQNAIFNAVSGDIRGEQISGLNSLFYYIYILAFKLSPITLILLLASILKLKKMLKIKNVPFIVLYFVTFLIALTLSDQKIDRYVIILLPSLLLYISIFLSKFKKKFLFSLLTICLLFTIWVVYAYFPIYSAYYSPLFGRNSQKIARQYKIYDNSGEYYAQAAFYLNTKGRNKNTWVPHNVESFSYFYSGVINRDYSEKVDYMVTSINHLDSNLQYSDKENFSSNVDDAALHTCIKLEKTFGNRISDVVFVFSC